MNLQTLASSEEGQDLVEYALFCCLIALAVITDVNDVATAVATGFTNISSSLAQLALESVENMVAENLLSWLSIPTVVVMTAGLILYICGIAGKQLRNISASGFRSTFSK